MIVVTGANGQLGRLVVEGLLKKIPSSQIGVSVRDTEHADGLKHYGIRICRGNFEEPDSLKEAFDGAEQILIISVGDKFGEEAVRQHGIAIQAAKDAGAKRILYTSHQGASPSSAFVPGRDHAATEVLLRSSGVPYVSLRNGFYAESAYQLSGLKETEKIILPEDGPVSWTARADLSVAAVAALTDPDLFDGISPPLTNSQVLDFADIAKIASQILGRSVVRETVSDEAYYNDQISHNVPEFMASALGTIYKASRAHEFTVVDSTLERLLGRSPTSMKDVLTACLSKPETKSSKGDRLKPAQN